MQKTRICCCGPKTWTRVIGWIHIVSQSSINLFHMHWFVADNCHGNFQNISGRATVIIVCCVQIQALLLGLAGVVAVAVPPELTQSVSDEDVRKGEPLSCLTWFQIQRQNDLKGWFLFLGEQAAPVHAVRGPVIYGLVILLTFLGCDCLFSTLLLMGNEKVSCCFSVFYAWLILFLMDLVWIMTVKGNICCRDGLAFSCHG